MSRPSLPTVPSRTPAARRPGASLLVVLALVAALVGLAPGGPAAAAPSVESRLAPSDPVRVLDTRVAGGRVGAGGTVDVPVAALLPAGATAAVLNVTVVAPAAPGFITAYAGPTRPATSNANTDEVGEIAANLVVVPLGGRSDVHVYSSSAADLVVDFLGAFVPASGSTAGRYRAVDPSGARLLDTRTEAPSPIGLAGGRALAVRGHAGVPGAGVRAVALNITVTETVVPGWVQVVPTGGTTAAGASSNVNVTRAGQTVANLAIVPVGADGSVTLVGSVVGHVIVDVAGWFTDATAPAGGDGLFVAVDPTRLADTRDEVGPPADGRVVPVRAEVIGVDAARVGAVLANLTLTEASAPGFVTAWPGTGTRPNTSSINADRAGATVANAGIVATDGPSFALYTQRAAHLVVDLLGWFTRGGGGSVPGAGAIVSTSPVTSGARIIYRSVGAAGALTQQVTLAYVPAGTPPPGGWPIMAIVHGPYGMGDQCALSIGTDTRGEASSWLERGYAVVLPDLEGIGVDSPGDHPYLHGPATARSMLDAVRAARAHFGPVLSNRIVTWGFSSGAHSSLFIGEYAPIYAPEIDVRGVVALDPVSVLSWQMGGTWNTAGFTVWWIQGQHAGDPAGLPYEQVLRPEAVARLPQLNARCLDEAYPLFDDIPGGPIHTNPMSLPNWAAAFEASDPGRLPSTAPVLLAGGNDFSAAIPALPHNEHNEYMRKACGNGTSVRFQIFQGGHMAMIDPPATEFVYGWVAERFAGVAQTGCTTSGP